MTLEWSGIVKIPNEEMDRLLASKDVFGETIVYQSEDGRTWPCEEDGNHGVTATVPDHPCAHRQCGDNECSGKLAYANGVLVERERCLKSIADELAEWNENIRLYWTSCGFACENIAKRIRNGK